MSHSRLSEVSCVSHFGLKPEFNPSAHHVPVWTQTTSTQQNTTMKTGLWLPMTWPTATIPHSPRSKSCSKSAIPIATRSSPPSHTLASFLLVVVYQKVPIIRSDSLTHTRSTSTDSQIFLSHLTRNTLHTQAQITARTPLENTLSIDTLTGPSHLPLTTPVISPVHSLKEPLPHPSTTA